MRKMSVRIAAFVAILVAALTVPVAALAADGVSMYRLYNPNSGEHLYTASAGERDLLKGIGWIGEGTGWVAPVDGESTYRLFNPNGGDHHYTTSAGERDLLVAQGWSYEGECWRSGGGVEVHRLYNPYASSGAHHYTTSVGERDLLVAQGWSYEGVGWCAIDFGSPEPEPEAPSYTYSIVTNTHIPPYGPKGNPGNLRGIDAEIIDAIAQDQGFDCTVQFVGYSAGYEMVLNGQADGLMAYVQHVSDAREALWEYDFSDPYCGDWNRRDPYDMFLLVKKGENPELLSMFNAGLANIKANGVYDDIIIKYFPEWYE